MAKYQIAVIPINLILLIIALFYITKAIFFSKNKKISTLNYILILIVIFVLTFDFWRSFHFNTGKSNRYNFVQMYGIESVENKNEKVYTNIMYHKILRDIKTLQSNKIAIITLFWNEPELKKLKIYNDRIDLFFPSYSSRKLLSKINNNEIDYDLDLPKKPIKKEAIKRLIDEYELVYFIYSTKRHQKYIKQTQYINELNFEKISGESIDKSGIEIYRFIHSND